ncbi:MAG: hypothetical protein BGO47_03200 [Microbacterium sp. 67-17]|uniref:glycosyltransferase family protein n=1 Tax=Microbacterium sp. 67-17 TaxID=1895782 RepID=UPI00096496BC|nr:glycosyltransferase [Microbacterium sp. 67-17]OJV95498.1 MAG: hypothetical protein BGO47_03200 [Microbacterium sp. 67-17]
MIRRLRAAWRAARSWPGVGSLLALADRMWWARRIRRARIVDVSHVGAQLGRRVGERAAVRAYVRGGHRAGLSMNPLFCEATASRQLSDADRVPALYAYLVNDRDRIEVSPNWDAPGYLAAHPEAREDPAGPLGHLFRAARAGSPVPLGCGARIRPVPWSEVRERARQAAEQSRRRVAVTLRSDADVNAELELQAEIGPEEDADETLALASVIAGARPLRTCLLLRDPTPDEWIQASLLSLWLDGCTVSRGAISDAAAAPADGVVLVRGAGARLSAADALALADAGRSRPTAPLWLAPDGTIASAGLVRVDGAVRHLLAGHPREDAARLGERIDVPALAGGTFAVPAGGGGTPQTLLTATVFAPAAAPAGSAPATTDDIAGILRPAGLRPAGVDPDGRLRLARVTPAPRRWAIRTASPAGLAGESWGDTHFARGIAAALRRLGEEVVIDAYDARERPSTALDDITLVLRGPRRIDPPSTGRSILWVISHPDEITREEVAGFDRVFAASIPWAARASHRFGLPVLPLLQCTDAHRFRTTGAVRGDDLVFVGTARGIARPAVVTPIRAGIPLRVYGPDWRGYIPAANIAATGIPNAELPLRYETAAAVLNDHWPAMQAEGFISNRPYDVVAAGGRVISDHVTGIEDVFGPALVTFDTPEDLVALLSRPVDALFGADAAVATVSERIRRDHSFDARAATLVQAARELASRAGTREAGC